MHYDIIVVETKVTKLLLQLPKPSMHSFGLDPMSFTYYDPTEDKTIDLTQYVLDQMQDTGLMQYKRNAVIMKITNLHVKKDRELILLLCRELGIK